MSELFPGLPPARAGTRRRRSDRGCSRLAPRVEARLQRLLDTADPPRVSEIDRELRAFCRSTGARAPSRATIYNAMARIESESIDRRRLPDSVARTLHNVGGDRIPGHQVVFAAFNYGDTRALCYAAGLPWAYLLRASQLRGWRPKSRALLMATLAIRRKRSRA